MAQAKYEILKDDNSYYGEIPGVQGVWSNEKTLAKCEKILREVLEEWILIKLKRNEKLPIVKRINLNLPALKAVSMRQRAFA